MDCATPSTYRQPTGTQTRDELILDNLDFVARILSTLSFRVQCPDLKESLRSAGLVGLVEAAHGFDPANGTKFRTFAFPRIRGAILDEMRKQSVLPSRAQKKVKLIRKAYETLEPPVTIDMLMEETGLDHDSVVDGLEAMKFCNPGNWNDLSDVIHGSWRHNTDSPGRGLESQEMIHVLSEAIEALPNQQRIVVTLYFLEELKLKEIAEAMELSEARISRVLTAAKFNLQEAIRCKTN